jgi:hypothetical protein
VADDMVKRVIIAAEQKVALINTAFMEDLVLLQFKILQAGAGTSAWAGFVETKINIFNEQRTVVRRRVPFFAVQQLQRHLKEYRNLERLPQAARNVRVYRWTQEDRPVWVAWLDPGKLLLPEDAVPSSTVKLKTGAGQFILEKMIDQPGQTRAEQTAHQAVAGHVEVLLTPRPLYILGK